MILKKIVDRPKNVVYASDIKPGDIVIASDDEKIGICNIYDGDMLWSNGNKTSVGNGFSGMSSFRPKNHFYLVDLETQKLTPIEPRPEPNTVFVDDVNPNDKVIVVAKTYMGLVVGDKVIWSNGVTSINHGSLKVLYNQIMRDDLGTLYLVSDGKEQ